MVRNAVWLGGLVAIAGAVAGLALLTASRPETSKGANQVHLILIGASIGQAWRMAEWPARVQVQGITAESIPAWQFDKTEVVQEVAMRPARKFRPTRTYLKSLFQPPPKKPDIVILKECSSYFPGELSAYQNSFRTWVRQIQAAHAKVMLATVVPVTKARAAREPGKQENLVTFNRWIREFAQQQGIPVLDLESALAADGSDRYLKDDFAVEDGSHLNPTAYGVLDLVLRNTLCATTAINECLTQTKAPPR